MNRQLILTLMALAGALALFAAAAALRASASGGAAVGIEPPSQVVEPGESVKIDLAASGVANLGAWEVRLKYNPQVLSFQSFEGTSWMASTGRQVTCPGASIDAAAGTVLLGCGSVGLTPPGPAGDGMLGRVTLTAKAAGTSNLEITKVSLADPDGDECCGAVTIAEGAVRVGSEDAPLPSTPTPNPRKLTPTPVDADLGEQLVLTPAAGTSAGNETPSASGSGTPVARVGRVAGATSDPLFGGAAGAQAGGTGAPIAGTGLGNAVPSRSAMATIAMLGAIGLLCIAATGVGRMRRIRRGTARVLVEGPTR